MAAEDYIQDETFDRGDFTKVPLRKGEYEGCAFSACDVSNGDLSGIKFTDCHFTGCNLSNTKLAGTSFSKVRFKDCKMLGLRLDACNPFGLDFSFHGCALNLASFYGLKISKTVMRDCRLDEADFTDCNLSESILEGCDLTGATFDNTQLEKADLRSSFGFLIDPERNRIKKARFSLSTLPGLLHKYNLRIEHT